MKNIVLFLLISLNIYAMSAPTVYKGTKEDAKEKFKFIVQKVSTGAIVNAKVKVLEVYRTETRLLKNDAIKIYYDNSYIQNPVLEKDKIYTGYLVHTGDSRYKPDSEGNSFEIEKKHKAGYLAVKVLDKQGNIYYEVHSSYTGDIWLDRNLGASRVCQSIDDKQCYGDYFQWGANKKGWKNNYIANDNLWRGVNGKNNPCPKGFRIPTLDELTLVTVSQGLRNRKAIFNSFLKLPPAGYRYYDSGSMDGQGSEGHVWSSSSNDKYLYFSSSNDAGEHSSDRASGFSVRCIKD